MIFSALLSKRESLRNGLSSLIGMVFSKKEATTTETGFVNVIYASMKHFAHTKIGFRDYHEKMAV